MNKKTTALTTEQYRAIITTMKEGGAGFRLSGTAALSIWKRTDRQDRREEYNLVNVKGTTAGIGNGGSAYRYSGLILTGYTS